jgi:CRP/FNR family cyclic AMP-dependent transcriptional regulator
MTKILLVEDNTEIRENIGEILELAGYKVSAAANGKEGYEKALAEHPDLILCDIMMPVLDGYGLLHLINKNENLSDVPFIFLTAKTERGDLRKGMEMGADDYIMKPFNDVELLSAIESRLHKINLHRKKAISQNSYQEFLKEVEGDIDLETFSNAQPAFFKKKQQIYAENKRPYYLFYLNKGKIRTFRVNDAGKELTIGLYNTGDFFGYHALLNDSTYCENAETLEESEISMIPREDFEKLVNNNKKVARQFIKLLANHVVEREEQLINLAYNSLRKRVADAIVTLLKKYKVEGDLNFSINISREDIAHIAGTTTESLIRTLSDFKHEKLIDTEAGTVKVLQEEKLIRMAN